MQADKLQHISQTRAASQHSVYVTYSSRLEKGKISSSKFPQPCTTVYVVSKVLHYPYQPQPEPQPQLIAFADCSQGPTAGQPGCRFDHNPGFSACVQDVRRSIIAATAATSLMACFLMGAVANLPLAVAPGMGKMIQFFT